MRLTWRSLAVPLVVIVTLALCGRDGVVRTPQIEAMQRGGLSLEAVTMPVLSDSEPAVRVQLLGEVATVAALIREEADDASLAGAFGEMGRVFLAAEHLDQAKASFRNAEMLAPGDVRWPYYLAHIYRYQGASDDAVEAFERVLLRRPGDLTTLIWLGRLELQRGRPDAARQRFTEALEISPDWAPALAGVGLAALAQRRFDEARSYLEQALDRNPEASSLQYSLSLAYRELGDPVAAETHLGLRGNVDVPLADPFLESLGELLESPLAYQRRGIAALDRRAWAEAAQLFRRGLELAGGASEVRRLLQQKLGTALYMQGDVQGAMAQFEEVAETFPDYAANLYSLGVVLVIDGREDEAIARFRDAVRADPDYAEAHQELADALRRVRRDAEAIPEYEQALRLHPGEAPESLFGAAMAMLRLGRYAEAVARLGDGISQHPDDWRFPHALARVLATAADARVRDGAEALRLTQRLESTRGMTVELAETRAMALAELGRFEEAVGWQREVVAALREGGSQNEVDAAVARLSLYERRQPSRTAYRDDHPVFHPGATTVEMLQSARRDGP